MRDYGVIHTAYWTDEKISALSVPAKLLGAYLLTCPHSNAIGCFRLPLGYISEDLRWDAKTVRDALAELAGINFICREDASGWTFIRKFLEHNTIENPNVGKACMRMVDAVPSSFPFFGLLITALEPYEKRFPDGYLDGLRRKIKQPLNGSVNGSGNGSPNGSGNRMPNPEPEPNQERSSVASATGAVAAPVAAPVADAFSLKAKLFGGCLDWLAESSGKSQQSLRPLIGRWIAAHGEGAALGAIVAAQREDAVAPISFIEAVLKSGGRHGRKSQSDPDALIRGLRGAFGDLLDPGPTDQGGGRGEAAIGYH